MLSSLSVYLFLLLNVVVTNDYRNVDIKVFIFRSNMISMDTLIGSIA